MPIPWKKYNANGSGHQFSSYRPSVDVFKADIIKWMTTSIPWNNETYAADEETWQRFDSWLEGKTGKTAIADLQRVNRNTGDDTWYWPRFPACKCKPMSILKFESGRQITHSNHYVHWEC